MSFENVENGVMEAAILWGSDVINISLNMQK